MHSKDRPGSVPEGYTYMRCDLYSADDFVELFQNALARGIAKEYVRDNPKEQYNTDDEITVYGIIDDKRVPGLLHGQHRHTTKRTYYMDR